MFSKKIAKYVSLSMLVIVFLLFCSFSQAAILKGIIGVHSTYSDGSNTVAELCTKAKQLHYDYLIFTEKYEDMNSTKWSGLVSDCSAQTGSGFFAVAGLDIPSLFDGKTIRVFSINPTSFPTDTTLFSLLFSTGGNNVLNPCIAAPALNEVNIWSLKFYRAMEMFTYGGGSLIQESVDDYLGLVDNMYYVFPMSGHRIYSTTDLEGLENDYKTYYRDSVLSNNYFISNGPLVTDFNVDNAGWWVWGTGEKKEINISASSANPITSLTMYKNGQVFRQYHPNVTEFTITENWYPVEAARFYFVVRDSAGKKAYSNYCMIQSTPFNNAMCMDNQNNIPVLIRPDVNPGDDNVLFGVAHTGTHVVGFFCNRPSYELVPEGQETGLAGAVYRFAAGHKVGSSNNWTGYDKIAYWLKSTAPGLSVGPRWMNNGEYGPYGPLFATPEDTAWHYYEIDLGDYPRDNVSDFMFYIPTQGYEYTIWLDDLKLIDSSTGEEKVLDDFESGTAFWGTTIPDNYISWVEDDAPQGTYCLKDEVKWLTVSPWGMMVFRGIEMAGPTKLVLPLGAGECGIWQYQVETDDYTSYVTYTMFVPPLYKYTNAVIDIRTEFKQPPNLDYTVEPGQFGLDLSYANTQKTLGDWLNFAYLDAGGDLVTGSFASTSPQAMPILNKGFAASFPNQYGSYAYFPMEDRPYAFSGVNGDLRIGYVDKPTDYIQDDVLESRFLFILDAGSGYFTQPDDFQTFRDVYGFDGSTAYDAVITKGTLLDDVYVLRLQAAEGEVRGTISAADLPNNLPIIVEGLDDNIDAVAYNKTTGEFKHIPVVDGKGYLVLDISSGADFIMGNLVKDETP